jgi:molybdenum cofactor biosynthesis enzyme MoaA
MEYEEHLKTLDQHIRKLAMQADLMSVAKNGEGAVAQSLRDLKVNCEAYGLQPDEVDSLIDWAVDEKLIMGFEKEQGDAVKAGQLPGVKRKRKKKT